MCERKEMEIEYLSKMKHVSGDFNRWITKFEDQVETCETIGLELDEDAKLFHFMNSLNDTIFRESKAAFVNLSTRALYPNNYEDIKQRMIDEYGQMMARKPQLVLDLREKNLDLERSQALKPKRSIRVAIRDATFVVRLATFFVAVTTAMISLPWIKIIEIRS